MLIEYTNIVDENHNSVISCIRDHYARHDSNENLMTINENDLNTCEYNDETSFASDLMNGCIIVKHVSSSF